MFLRRLILNKMSSVVTNNLFLKNKGNFLRQPITRNSHTKALYRKTPGFEYTENKLTVFINSVMWWWIFWQLFTDYHVFLGYNYPDPSEWTDEELGIPEE